MAAWPGTHSTVLLEPAEGLKRRLSLRLHYGHGRYCSTTDGMCFLHVCPGHTCSGTGSPVRQVERVPLSSTLSRRSSSRRLHFIFMVVSRPTSLDNVMRMTFSFLYVVQCQSWQSIARQSQLARLPRVRASRQGANREFDSASPYAPLYRTRPRSSTAPGPSLPPPDPLIIDQSSRRGYDQLLVRTCNSRFFNWTPHDCARRAVHRTLPAHATFDLGGCGEASREHRNV